MASPKEMVECVARVLGVAAETVTVHDRNLLSAGLRTEGVRGRGTSAVTPTDAANLLVAAVASRNVKDSAATVARFADEARAVALDIERAMTRTKPPATYSLRSTSGEAFWVAGFSGNAVQAVADLLAKS